MTKDIIKNHNKVASDICMDKPLWLKELIDKGKFLRVHYPKLHIKKGHFVILGQNKIKQVKFLDDMELNKNFKIAMFRDGPFLPSREGGSNRVYNLIKYLHRDGWEVCAIHCYRGWSNYKMIMKEDFTTILLNPEDYYNKYLILRVAKKMGIRIVDFDYPEAILSLGQYLKNEGFLVSYNAQNVISELLSSLGVNKRVLRLNTNYEKLACSIADLVHCCSDKDKKQLKRLHYSKNKYITVPNGADVRLLKFNDKYNPDMLFFIGNLFYEPNEIGLKKFIYNVMPYVMANAPKTKLVIIGDTPVRLIKEMSRINNINFVGPKDNLNKITSKGGIGIAYITIGSGTRLKLLNYFALGLPSVATSIAAEGLSVKNENNILISNSFLQFALNIKKLQEDRKLYKMINKNARNLVETKYTWSISASILEKGYNNISQRSIK